MSRVTIREVAAMAGVAVSTVSAVLNDNGSARVASTTRARVLEAVDVLGYVPHPAARALRGQTLGCLALIDDDVSFGPYGGQMLAGVHDVCTSLGILVITMSTTGSSTREDAAILFTRSLDARGIVLASVSETLREAPAHGSVVLLNGHAPEDDVPGIVADHASGSAAVVRELLEFGHQRFGVVTVGPCEPADRRLRAIQRTIADALGESAVPDGDLVVTMANVEATAGGGYEAGRRLLELTEPPTAVVCFNDRMATGVYRAVAERGWSVPRDVSVVGFDNAEPVADSLEPGLTTAALPEREMGQLAALLALGIDPDEAPPEGVEVTFAPGDLTRQGSTFRLRCPLVRRGSVGRPRTPAGALPPTRVGRT